MNFVCLQYQRRANWFVAFLLYKTVINIITYIVTDKNAGENDNFKMILNNYFSYFFNLVLINHLRFIYYFIQYICFSSCFLHATESNRVNSAVGKTCKSVWYRHHALMYSQFNVICCFIKANYEIILVCLVYIPVWLKSNLLCLHKVWIFSKAVFGFDYKFQCT